MRSTSPLQSVLQFLARPAVSPLIALILACAFFALQSDLFLTGRNLSLILQQVLVVGTLAIGQTLIILTAGIDLSNGMIMALGSVLMTKLAVVSGVDPLLAMFLAVGVCILCGALNGILVALLNLPPFIVTLGTYSVIFALIRIYTVSSINRLPPVQTALGETFKIGNTAITYSSVLMVILYLVVWYILSQTAVGRHVYAVGGDPEAARLTGIPVKKVLFYVYVFAGLLYGIAAIFLIARTESGNPMAGQNANLESITAVVLGGTSLFGGRGHIMGTLLGALVIGVLRNGLQLTGVPSIYQVLFTGILVIVAVSIDQLSRRGRA